MQAVVSVAGKAVKMTQVAAGVFALGGTIISVGGSAVDFGGYTVSADESGVVVFGTGLPRPREPGASHVGGRIHNSVDRWDEGARDNGGNVGTQGSVPGGIDSNTGWDAGADGGPSGDKKSNDRTVTNVAGKDSNKSKKNGCSKTQGNRWLRWTFQGGIVWLLYFYVP
jgi:hypothetical protein